MNLNRIGMVIYRTALVGGILFIAVTFRQLAPELRLVNVQVHGDVDTNVAINAMNAPLDVNVKELVPVDFVKNAFSGSGTLDVYAGPLDIGSVDVNVNFDKDAFLTSGLGGELSLIGVGR